MMLCSRCSEPIRPVVALDIDGTLAPYHPHFIEFASSWLGREPTGTPYTGGGRFRDWATRAYEIDLTTFRMIKLAYRQGGLKRTMGTYPGAGYLVQLLRASGAEVWLTTTRPHDRYDRIDPDTVEWAKRNAIEFDGLLFEEEKMDVLEDRVDSRRVIAVLDDLTEVLSRVRLLGMGTPILRRTEYNAGVCWTGWQYSSLEAAADAILDLMRSFNESNCVGSEPNGRQHRSSDLRTAPE